ncbi:carbon-nitrogen hydrolase family protein [Siminovitchia terrae]|uniref:Carbon-nitrogen hydrolase family protein n=1 Tax=Siminovitchia terrae TaxID=1914933 RepID=A0A429X8L3_SIMTE|nr:carbon-nitrogen hydrolase family protein [Siminovitchia terrae]RST59767.1 carbon-nitrogen hydrolase family protein [Siminovitchia terrae]
MLTIGLAQLKSTFMNKQDNIKTAITTMRECKEKAVDLIVFPEMFLTGYALKENVYELAEPLEGPSLKQLCKAARENQIGVVIGFPERKENQYFNSAVFIQKDGTIQGVYRKVHLFEWEKNIFTAGNDGPLFTIEDGKISLMMTFDAGFPEMSRIYALNGAEMIIVLSAHVVPYQIYHKIMMSARALENQVFLAVVNKVGLEEQSVYFGESAIISPYGDYLNKIDNQEKVIIESIDLSLVYKTRESLSMKYLENRNLSYFKKSKLCKPYHPDKTF